MSIPIARGRGPSVLVPAHPAQSIHTQRQSNTWTWFTELRYSKGAIFKIFKHLLLPHFCNGSAWQCASNTPVLRAGVGVACQAVVVGCDVQTFHNLFSLTCKNKSSATRHYWPSRALKPQRSVEEGQLREDNPRKPVPPTGLVVRAAPAWWRHASWSVPFRKVAAG